MKEAFWGALIVILGLFGIVVVNIFQNVTVDNDRVYYLIKESTEAAAFDALDLTQYRLNGTLRIVEDKFVENLTRRFAENVTIGDYTIIVEDINEVPPKVSLRVRSGVTSLNGEEFGIVNRVDGILETKYSLDDVLDFLGITEDEWKEYIEATKIEVDSETGENVCKTALASEDDLECVPGDLMFDGFGDATVAGAVCQDETLSGGKERVAKYKVCNCGKWTDASETVTALPVKAGNEWIYTWTFTKSSEVRTITESVNARVLIQTCTTGIGEMVPKDIEEKKPNSDGTSYEPSTDNSEYVTCPAGGIKIPVGMKFTLHPNYIPANSINRNLTWTVTDDTIIGIQSSNPLSTCILNGTNSNCFSKAIVTAKNVGSSYVNVKTTRGQTATCKVEVFDGSVSSIDCKDVSVAVGKSTVLEHSYSPKNATKINVEYSISNSAVATISGNTITAKAGGSATITIKETNSGKTGTCKVTVPSPPEPPKTFDNSGGSSGSSGSSGSGSNSGYWKVTDPTGKVSYYSSYEDAKSAAVTASSLKGGEAEISYKNSGSDTEIKYSEVDVSGGSGNASITETIYNGNLSAQTQISEHTSTTGITTTTTIDLTNCTNPNDIDTCKKTSDTVNANSGSGSSSGSSSGGSYVNTQTGGTTDLSTCMANCPINNKCECCGTCTSTTTTTTKKTTTTTTKSSCMAQAACHQAANSACGGAYTGCNSGPCYTYACAAKTTTKKTTTTTKKTTTTTKKTTTKATTKKATTTKKNSCFEAGTKVLTSEGYKDINKLSVGDKVLSYNENTKKNEYKEVTKVYIHDDFKDVLYSLTINNKVVKATRLHRFYIKTYNGYEWIAAEDLKVGDLVMDSNGKYYQITKISAKTVVSDFYNLEVKDNHNYYVTEDNILVHNVKSTPPLF